MPIERRKYLAAFLMSFSAAFMLGGYEFVRSPANTLFKAAYGAGNLPVVMACIGPALVAALCIYGRLISWLGPRRTLLATSFGSALVILLCHAAVTRGFAIFTGVLYVVKEVYVILLVEQYWSFINSKLDEGTARRLNGPICGLAGLGAISGGLLVGRFAVPFGTEALLVFGAVLTAVAGLFSDLGHRLCGEPHPTATEKKHPHGYLALSEFKASPVLIFILAVVLLTQTVSAFLDLSFQGILQDALPNPDIQTSYSGGFYAKLNMVAAFLQFVAAPLLLKFLSLRVIMAAIPLVNIAACVALSLEPSLATAATAFMVFKCMDYSIFRSAKELFYIPLSFDARYRAKEVVDVFGYRFGKSGTSLAIIMVRQMAVFAASAYSLAALAASMLWLVCSFPMTKKWRHD